MGTGTIWGLPAAAVNNMLQNFVMLALMYVGARAHLSQDTMGMWTAFAGDGLALAANYLTVKAQPPATPSQPSVPAVNGLAAH